jgi:hypothetical protein
MANDVDLSQEALGFVKIIDKKIGAKYGVSLQAVLSDPSVLAKSGDARTIVENLRNEVNNYLDSVLTKMEDEQKKFNNDLENANMLYKKLNEQIRTKAANADVPFIKPISVDRDESKDENIVVAQYEVAVELLVDKLLSVSNYVADVSTDYNNYMIGTWLFSGQKNHVLSVNPPSSAILNIEASRDEISLALDDVESSL